MLKKKHSAYLWIFLVPVVAYLLIWRIAPLGFAIFLSFSSWNFIEAPTPTVIGLANYLRLFAQPQFYHAIKVTLIFTMTALALETIIGVGIALLLDREIRGKNILRALIILPMMLTPVIVGTIWYILLHQSIGPINYFLEIWGINPPNWLASERMALISIIAADVWQWTPFIFLLALSSLQTIPDYFYDAAKIDGASGFQIYRYVSLPLISRTLFIAILLRSMDAVRTFDKIFVMTGGGPGTATETLSVFIYRIAFQFFEMGYAASIVVIFLIIVSLLYWRLMKTLKI